MTDTQTFEPDGRAIAYAVEGSGPSVVLMTEQDQNIASLGTLAHSVAQEDFRVVRITARTLGGEAAALSMRDAAQDVIDLMDHLEIDHAWVGGHGFGGSVARTVSFEHHERVNGVLLLGVEASGELAPLVVGVPVLVIQGTEDPITPPSNGDDLQASAPDRVSVVRVEGGGHMFPVTHVGATSWAIEDYLDWD